MKKIIIADDHQILLDGLESMLNGEEGFEVVAKCTNGAQVLHRLRENEPDILLLDINMPRMNGIEVTQQIRKDYPKVKIIALSMYKQPSYINRMMNLGAMGYILKEEGKDSILEALVSLIKGEKYLSKKVTEIVQSQKAHAPINLGITSREQQVLDLLAKGLSTQEISDQLYISFHTAKTHRKHLMRKFQVGNVSSLLIKAKDMGII